MNSIKARISFLLRASLVVSMLLLVCVARADVKLASPFTDHMVLQQGMTVPVWGWADPGEQVTVSFAGQKHSATAGTDGKWMARLNELKASADPQYESSTIEGDAIRLRFSHLGGGLVAKGGPLKAFEITGADGKYVPAEATIDSETVVVRSAGVTTPAAVRYAWANYPDGCNLYNAAGLPAPPFRTDRKSP